MEEIKDKDDHVTFDWLRYEKERYGFVGRVDLSSSNGFRHRVR